MNNLNSNNLKKASSLEAEQNVFEQTFKSLNTCKDSPVPNSASNSTTDLDNLSPEERAKRERFLERNRVAATKCRQKKKLWIKELNFKTDQEKIKNINLTKQVQLLKDQLLSLKAQLMPHMNCDCEIITQYKESQAYNNNANISDLQIHPNIE